MLEKKKSDLGHLPPKRLFVAASNLVFNPIQEALLDPVIVGDAKSKGGRPAKYPDKPWIAEGITRMTWYRRQKAKGK